MSCRLQKISDFFPISFKLEMGSLSSCTFGAESFPVFSVGISIKKVLSVNVSLQQQH